MTNTVPMQQPMLSVADLNAAFQYATEWLGVYVDEVNALNVYPVPDGDTGTNMHLTMQSVRRHIQDKAPKTLTELAETLARGSVLGARGNSGVILSQALKGLSDTFKQVSDVDTEALKSAFRNASTTAYKAVADPVEGTILTVIRRASEGLDAADVNTPLAALHSAWQAGKLALDETPEMLPKLKQAGVVDSGGLGFLRVLEGIIASVENRPLPEPPKVVTRAQQQFETEEFGFCTEFLLRDATKTDLELRELIASFGDSLLVVGAEGYIKGHIHTDEPEQLLSLVARYGQMVLSKVEDMSEQHVEIIEDIDVDTLTIPQNGMVAVSSGYGITKAFRSAGARVVGGGQTQNPSVEDIADAVRSVSAEHVIVMPNNKNIIMAAQQVHSLISDKTVHVLPTRSLGQGLAAAMAFNASSNTSKLMRDLTEVIENASTLEVTTAVRTAEIDGVSVHEGDHIGMVDGVLRAASPTAEACLKTLLDSGIGEAEVATLFYNSTFDKTQVEAFEAELSELYPDLEFELHAGCPDLYQYVLALE